MEPNQPSTAGPDRAVLPAPHRRLLELTRIPTTTGKEQRVAAWVRRWAGRRRLPVSEDPAGNLLIGAGPEPPDLVVAAHLDHPGFVLDTIDGRLLSAGFRGFVAASYFPGAAVEFFDGRGTAHAGRVVSGDGDSLVEIALARRAPALAPGDVGRWRFPPAGLGIRRGRLRAHACDDLAGVAAALEAFDRVRRFEPRFGVLLTRGEEEGFLGAIAAATGGTVLPGARILSVECSPALPEAPVGAGPVVRVGDASTVFDRDLTNRVAAVARRAEIVHQRRLMSGGSCEATAFGVYGLAATGLCLALGNHHNMVDLAGVRAGTARPRLAPEEVSLADFDGLVRLLTAVARGIDEDPEPLRERLDRLFAERGGLLAG